MYCDIVGIYRLIPVVSVILIGGLGMLVDELVVA